MSRADSKTRAMARRHALRRLGVVAVLSLTVALTAWQSYRLFSQPPPPPAIDTAGFDPAISASIAQARERVQKEPRSADARGRLGMILLAHEIRSPAVECFSQAAALASREPRWLYLLGLAQLQDDPVSAATNFERALQSFPAGTIAPRLRLAETLMAAARMDEAEAHYRQVLQHDPTSAMAWLGLGKVANGRGSAEQAAEFLGHATQDPTTRKAAHRLLVTVYQRLGRREDAERLAKVLADLPQDNPFPDPFLAEVQQFKTGEGAWVELADEWIKTGRVKEAAQLLEKTIQSYPSSDRAMFFLGRARSRLGDPAGAEAILLRATQLAPASVEAQVQLGVIQLSQGRPNDAQRAFRAAIKAKPNVPEAWFNLGLSLGAVNRAESEAAFREALRLKPDFPEAYLALAVILRAEGKKHAAADELRKALALNPGEPLRLNIAQQLKALEAP